MSRESKTIQSAQLSVHPRLRRCLQRYADRPSESEPAAHTVQSFAQVRPWLESGQSLILDSGCGTAESSRWLADQYPDHLILAVDQSAHRLYQAGLPDGHLAVRQGNLILIRADVTGFCQLMRRCGLRVDRHMILYPNPWPKARHLQRRYHAHPLFADMIRISKLIECRTNWAVYAEEFALVLSYHLGSRVEVRPLRNPTPVTAFERKYYNSGHILYQVNASVPKSLHSAAQ